MIKLFKWFHQAQALGADIVGVDLREELTPERFAEILKAWDEHLVLRFRGQDLSEDQFVRFQAILVTWTKRQPDLVMEAIIQRGKKLPSYQTL